MDEIKKHDQGSFCWIELGTSDANGAKQFYGDLFGWGINELPMEHGSYSMLTLENLEVGACYQLTEEQKNQDVPPHWLPYISVDDVDTTTEKVEAENGNVLMGPLQVMDAGKMSLLQDPTGATFGIWQGQRHIGSKIKNVPNSYCWVELGTNDTDAAEQFYSHLVNWEPKHQDFEGMKYTTFKNGPVSEGGMYKMPPEMDELPSHWLVYFNVEDCDDTVNRAKSLGAQVLKEPEFIPTVGKFSVLQDPQGAVFAVIKLDMPSQ